jgi:hypothetical protein
MAGNYPTLGRRDLVFREGDKRSGTRATRIVTSRISQHLVEDLLRQFGEDRIRVVRVDTLDTVYHYLISSYGNALI